MAETKVSKVGILLVTRNKDGKLVAVLQRRGQYNHEKDWEPKSFPGGCQLTAAGRTNEGESPVGALFREIIEELGDRISVSMSFSYFQRKHICGDATGEKFTIAMLVPRQTLGDIRWHPSTGGPVFVDAKAVSEIKNLLDFDKVTGVTDSRIIAMFPDEKEVVRKALEIIWE
jgi:hypothetical protein